MSEIQIKKTTTKKIKLLLLSLTILFIEGCNFDGKSYEIRFVPILVNYNSSVIYLEFSQDNSYIPMDLYKDRELQHPIIFSDFITIVSDHNDISITYCTYTNGVVVLTLSRNMILNENIGIKINNTSVYSKNSYSLNIPDFKILFKGYIEGYTISVKPDA